jgi:hypothetical protein
MPDYRKIAAQMAVKYHIDPRVFQRQIAQESGFDPEAKSPAGARGIAQIVPRWHPEVNPDDPIASLEFAARWMGQLYKQYGNYEQALSVYNSGKPDAYKDPHFASGQTYDYVRKIMGGVEGTEVPKVGSFDAPNVRAAKQSLASISQPLTKMVLDKKAYGLQALGDIASGNFDPERTLASVQSFKKQVPVSGARQLAPASDGPQEPALDTGQPLDIGKWVIKSAGMDREGTPTRPEVFQFAAKLARLEGHPLTIGTGSNHREFVNNDPSGHRSDHWFGEAADIPASGDALTRLGQDALIAAGADPNWARKQTGGVFNIAGYNILFNTKVGGNHYNHLHFGMGRILGRGK